MVESRTAVVVGAGIGGLAAACALHADGWDVRLLERADEVRPLGAGLALWRNAFVALDFLAPELAEQVSRRPRISGQAGLRTPDGRWLLRMSGSQVERRKDLPVMVERPELYAGLRAGVPETAFRFGRTVVEVRPDGDRTVVEASTANGDESYPADLVVGADGIGSRLRPLVDERSKRIAAGYLSWRGIVPAELVPADLAPAQLAPPVEPPIRAGRLPANLEDGGGETWGRGQRFGFSPLSDGGINWYATLATADPRAKSQLDRARLLDLVAGWHRPIEDLIQRTPDDRLLQNDTELLWPLPRTYVSGRLALLGDAAHAMTPDLGQGACQALEDAVELATVVRSVRPADVPAALRRYDELRRPRTTKLARQARGIGRVSQLRNPLAAGLRDRLVRLVPVDAAMRGLDATLDWQPSAPRANRAT